MYWTDWIWILGYLGLVLSIGLYAGRRETGSADFWVGNRRMPWPAVLGSIVATEISAATFLAVPGVGFGENLNYLQFGIGSFLARFFIAFVFLTVFYRQGVFSIYEYLNERFGRRSQVTASLFFIGTRLLASGVRLMIAVSGVSIILDIPFWFCLLVFSVLTVVYTASGGIKAVIWTDCLQALVFLSAGVVALIYIMYQTGWTVFWETAQEGQRLDLFNARPEGEGILAWLSDPNWLPVAMVFGFVSTVAALGVDQDLTQRMLTCRDVKRARISLIMSGFFALPTAALFLFVGIGLFVLNGGTAEGVVPDQAFPAFIAGDLPMMLRGLLLTGVLAASMSSLDSAMAALSSSAVVDLLRPLKGDKWSDGDTLRWSRYLTVVFAVVLAGIALLTREGDTFLWLAFQMTSITYAGLLGVFLLGVFTRRGSDRSNVWAMLLGALVVAGLLVSRRLGYIELGWTWYLLLGTCVTFVSGLLLNWKAKDFHSCP